MQYTTRDLPGGVSAVALQGDLDTTLDAQFIGLTAWIDQQRRLIIDLSGVSALPPTWLHGLWTCARTVLGRGGSVAFVASNPHVMRALRASGVAGILPVVTTMEAATAAIRGDGAVTEEGVGA